MFSVGMDNTAFSIDDIKQEIKLQNSICSKIYLVKTNYSIARNVPKIPYIAKMIAQRDHAIERANAHYTQGLETYLSLHENFATLSSTFRSSLFTRARIHTAEGRVFEQHARDLNMRIAIQSASYHQVMQDALNASLVTAQQTQKYQYRNPQSFNAITPQESLEYGRIMRILN